MGPSAVKRLTYELEEQAAIYFEEGLYINGLEFLTSLLTSGVASHGAIHVPSSGILGLINTLSIHPVFTNRAKDPETAKVSLLSNRYLRLVGKLVEPNDPIIADAYSWPEVSLTRRGGLARRRQDDDDEQGSNDLVGLRSHYARDRSLFWKTSDFWAAVGWAFRCSVLHPLRWSPWELWLENIIATLERDLNERFLPEAVTESLVAKYAKGSQQRQRIPRAIFADGSDRFANEFPEVWRNETKPRPKKNKDAKDVKAKKIDFDNDEFGDYLDVSTDDEHEDAGDPMEITGEDKPRSGKQGIKHEPDATAQLGGHAATKLRMRLFGLVVRLACELPGHFGNTWTLYDSCLEYFKPLPLPAFSVIISPQMLDPMPEDAAISLIKFVAHSLIQTGTKSSRNTVLDQDSLVEGYLPYTANTNIYVDNARLSICFEVLLRMLDLQRKLRWDADLEFAVEKGIERRARKATTAKGKKGEANGETDLEKDRLGLADSSMRLRMLVHLNKVTTERAKIQ